MNKIVLVEVEPGIFWVYVTTDKGMLVEAEFNLKTMQIIIPTNGAMSVYKPVLER